MRATHQRGIASWVALVALLLILLPFATIADAGFIPNSVDVGFSPPGPPPWAGSGGPPPFVFEIVPDNSALATLEITEDIGGLDPLNLVISGVTDNDPTLEITKNVKNDSGVTWIGYEIGLGGGSNSFVSGMSSSDKMTLASETSSLLTFGLPSPVANGETVSFNFKISIPSSGPFSFDLSQQAIPVPEATSVLLLTVGIGLCCSFRRR